MPFCKNCGTEIDEGAKFCPECGQAQGDTTAQSPSVEPEPQPAQPTEKKYYQDKRVNVTNTRAILDGKTYAMANITSVSMGSNPPNRLIPVILILAALASGLCGASVGGEWTGGGIGIGVFLLAAGILILILRKTTYSVRIGSASGESNILSSSDKDYIQKIVEAMNQAIVERG